MNMKTKLDALFTMTNRNAINFNQFFTLTFFERKRCSCFLSIKASNCGFVSDRARRMSSFTFNRFRLQQNFIVTKDKNPYLPKYVGAKMAIQIIYRHKKFSISFHGFLKTFSRTLV